MAGIFSAVAVMTQVIKILLAEDNFINQQVVAGLISPLECELDIVENGVEAVAAVTRKSYGLVLMDVNMPEMDGLEATRKIRLLPEPRGSIPIIAVTANTVEGDRARCLAAGMTDYIAKPIDPMLLLDAISRCIG